MVIQIDAYPGVGYQQPPYAVRQQEGHWYPPPTSYQSYVPQMPPSSTITQPSNHHQMIFDGDYAPPHEGWIGKNNHHRMKFNGGGYAQSEEGRWSVQSNHQYGGITTQPSSNPHCMKFDEGDYTQPLQKGRSSQNNHEYGCDVPMASTVAMQVAGYEYGTSWGGDEEGGGGRPQKQSYDEQYYPRNNGYQKVEYWAVKGI